MVELYPILKTIKKAEIMKQPLQSILSLVFIVLTSLTAYGQLPGEVGYVFEADMNNDPQQRAIFMITSMQARAVTLQSYIGTKKNVNIPRRVSYLNGNFTRYFCVTAIASNAFREKQLREVTIPDDITTIGTFAFRENQLSSIRLGSNVTHIGHGAFRLNELTKVLIPDSVVDIGGEAFVNNPITKVMVQGNTPPILGTDTFTDRATIEVIVSKGNPLGSNKTVYETAGWTGFKSITEDVVVGDTFTADNHITYRVTSTNPHTVIAISYNTDGGTNVTIPKTVDHDSDTFAVTAIGDYVFDRKQLTSVTFESPSHVTSIGLAAFQHNQLTSITIPDSMISIGVVAFQHNQLTSVVIPNTVTSIELGAFTSNQLSNVIFESPSSLTSIVGFVDNQLEHVEIPEGVTSIESGAFYLNKLISVTISSSVTNIEYGAFSDNPDLGLLTVKANNPPTLGFEAFTNRKQIDLIVPKGRKQAYLSNGWTGFKSIKDPEIDDLLGDTFTHNAIEYQITAISPDKEVTIINYTGAGGAVTIPQTVNHALHTFTVMAIDPAAFKQKQLTSVTIPSSMTSIGLSAFEGNQLTTVTIPNNVTSIEFRAFSGNQLTSVEIPENMTNIGKIAFISNPNLGLVTVKANTPPTLHVHSFVNANRSQIDLVVPINALGAYRDSANGWTGFKSIRGEGSTLSLHDNHDLNDFKIYPNPASDTINIQLHDGQELKQVNIYNVSGRHLYSEPASTIDVSRLSGGMYLLEVVTKTGVRAVKRIIIE